MIRLAILSDTHIPSRAGAVPDWVEAEITAADHVIHAGDFDSSEALATIQDLADGDLTAVTGNMDRGLSLPTTATLVVEGHTFVVTHGTGSPAGYEDRVRSTARDATDDPNPIAVSGHTHEVLDSSDGLRVLNPGSATGAAPASAATMMRATVTPESVDVEVLRG